MKSALETPTVRRVKDHFGTRPTELHTRNCKLTPILTREDTKFTKMSAITDELSSIFAVPPVSELPPDVSGELQSICRLHSISPQELSYKWESYSMKMGSEQTKLDLATVRAFKKDLQEIVERESRSRSHMRSADRKGAYATPRNAAKVGDAFGMSV